MKSRLGVQLLVGAVVVAVGLGAGMAVGGRLEAAAASRDDPEVAAAVAETAAPQAEPVVVSVGKVTVPIYRPKSVTYVLADVSVVLENEAAAEALKDVGKATRLKNDLLFEMVKLSETDVFLAPKINTEFVKNHLMSSVTEAHPEVKAILLDQVLKQDMIRS